MDLKEIQGKQLKYLPKKKKAELREKILEIREGEISKNRVAYWKPFKWQTRFNDMVRVKNVTVGPIPNKVGKTFMGAHIIWSWCVGYEPWNPVDRDHPEATKVGHKYYHKSSLGIKPPVKIRITGEDWTHHLGETVVPELKNVFPVGAYTTKKNNQGIDYLWRVKSTKSTIELMTHDQDDKLYESWMGHGWWPDEPPPKSKYTGMSRGLFGSGGKVFMPTTPLREAWVLDDLVLSNRKDIGVIDGLSILDNDVFKQHDDKLLVEMGLDEDQITEFYRLMLEIPDQGRAAESFLEDNVEFDKQKPIMKLKLLRMVKDCPLEERDTRLFGSYKALVGRVLKQYDKDKHIVEAFPVPTDWIIVPFIDWHLNKPHAISFIAFNPHGMQFTIEEVWENMTADEVAELLINKKRDNKWRCRDVFIDNLAKGDDKFTKNINRDTESSYEIIRKKIRPHGMILYGASKDKDNGITNLNSQLKGVNGIPLRYYFDTLNSAPRPKGGGSYGTLHEALRWVYDDDGKPKKENDHFMENEYRSTVSGIKWRPVQVKRAPQPVMQDEGACW